MSEKSFAVVSVATAIVCGVFFYPPPPPKRADQASKAAIPAQPSRATARPVTVAVASRAAAQPADRPWLRKRLTHLKPSASLQP